MDGNAMWKSSEIIIIMIMIIIIVPYPVTCSTTMLSKPYVNVIKMLPNQNLLRYNYVNWYGFITSLWYYLKILY